MKILTSGLLGEQYIGIQAGADEKNLAQGDTITATQSAVVLENLIGQFLFNKAAEASTPAVRQYQEMTAFTMTSGQGPAARHRCGSPWPASWPGWPVAPAARTPTRAIRSSPSTARSCSSTRGSTRSPSSRLPRSTRTSCRPWCAPASAISSATWATPGRSSTACCNSNFTTRAKTSCASTSIPFFGFGRHPGHRQRAQHRTPQGRLRPDAGPLGRSGRSLPRAAFARPVDCARYAGAAAGPQGRPAALCGSLGNPVQPVRAASGGHSFQPAARQLGPGRGGAGQVQLHPRRAPAKAAGRNFREQDLGRQRARSPRPTASPRKAPVRSRPWSPLESRHPVRERQRRMPSRSCTLLQPPRSHRNRAADQCSNEHRGKPRMKRIKQMKRRILIQLAAVFAGPGRRRRPAAAGAGCGRGAGRADQATVGRSAGCDQGRQGHPGGRYGQDHGAGRQQDHAQRELSSA